jgi:hypothetical protein
MTAGATSAGVSILSAEEVASLVVIECDDGADPAGFDDALYEAISDAWGTWGPLVLAIDITASCEGHGVWNHYLVTVAAVTTSKVLGGRIAQDIYEAAEPCVDGIGEPDYFSEDFFVDVGLTVEVYAVAVDQPDEAILILQDYSTRPKLIGQAQTAGFDAVDARDE